ncbi:MAG TPA: ABC transporter substrate-binding protein, partial [Acidimicrobiales bacterium]|nr:ABC transporter substrate-binding protein [Acidimicrobiales bacterium]
MTTRVVGLVVAMTLVAAACGSDDAAVGTGDCDSVDQVSLQLQWVTQAQFAGYFAAVDQGIYDKYCLDVTVREGGVDIAPQQQLASGASDFAVSWVPKALVSRE